MSTKISVINPEYNFVRSSK